MDNNIRRAEKNIGKDKKKKTEDYKIIVGSVKKRKMIEIKLYRQSNCLSIVMSSWISILEELRKR